MAEDTTGGRKPSALYSPKGKTKRQRRGEAAMMGFDPFRYLVERCLYYWYSAHRDKLALELLPYCKPKLKAVDMKMGGEVTINVTIGGDDPAKENATDEVHARAMDAVNASAQASAQGGEF